MDAGSGDSYPSGLNRVHWPRSTQVQCRRRPEATGKSVPQTTSSIVPSWLLKAKVRTPGPGAGHVPRDSLLQRLDAVLECRFAALQAPAGFGKTTVLADFSRAKKAQGLPVAWISLDEDDTPSVFAGYLTYAFECAGLDLSVLSDLDNWSSSPPTNQVGMLARAIDQHAAPSLLVLDEVDRLPPATVELVQRLVEHGPDNLHLALAFRSNPGLDLAMRVLDGSGIAVGVEELRFSRDEIDRFFDGALSRRELIAAEDCTAGWPVALTVHRSERVSAKGQPGVETAQLTSEFVQMRLLRSLSPEDRAFVFELAVFESIEPDLVDEVLGTNDTRVRIAALRSLDGLLAPIGEDGKVRRLHPLAKGHCVDLLTRENPVRKRFLHAGIAQALAARKRFLPAWFHARSSGESRLVAELVERAGLFDTWLRHGVTRLFAANEFVTAEIAALYPRLALLRSAVLRMAMNADEASALYESVDRATEGFTQDREGGNAALLAVDRVFTQAVLAGGSHQALHDEVHTLLPTGGVAASDEAGRLLLGGQSIVLCGSCHERARFDECRQHATMARAHFGEEKRYGNIVLDIYLGMSAMAQGRVREATACYARARRVTREHFSSDPCLSVWGDAVKIELDLERNRERALEPRMLKGLSELRAIWTDIDAAAIAVSAELMLDQHGSEAVTRFLVKTQDEVRGMRSESLLRYVSGLLVSHLAGIGSPQQAAQVWRDQALPEDVSELLDLTGQPWRTMESLACARIRLLAAQGEFVSAAALASSLSATTSELGLVRTLLRALALSMTVAEQAGWTERSLEHLVEFMRLAREADYIKPLVREREVSRVALGRLLGKEPDAETRDATESILKRLDGETPAKPMFSPRELEVLAEVRQGRRNKEIAGRLGISEPGVRFHLGNIYRKTGNSRREEAVRSAQSQGVLE